MNSVTLKNVVEYWESVLSDPAMQEAWKNYDALKGEPKVSNDRDDDSSPISRVIEDLKSWTMSESPDTPINAQRLKFLQQFAKVQITALEKASLSFGNDPEKQKLMAHLKTRLAEIESILPPESIERLSKNARNQQRLDEGQAAMLNRYRNWQAGTLSDDQRNVLKALQWQTASAPFQPGKSIAGYVANFAHERFKSPTSAAATLLISKLIWDSIEFMTDVTGAHQTEVDAAQQADALLSQTGSGNLPLDDSLFDELDAELASLSTGSQNSAAMDSLAASNAHCMEKVNTDMNLVGMAVDQYFAQNCDTISDGLQSWFSIATATPRTIQEGQKVLSEKLIAQETIAADSYNYHHEQASKAIETIAYYDNGLHIALLGLGALYAATLLGKHKANTPKHLLESIKQQWDLVKKRPLTLAGAGSGAATFAATHQGELLNVDIAPYIVVGALSGYMLQRASIHLRENKKFLFNLYADVSFTETQHLPPTSLDQKQPRYLLKAAFGYAALSTLSIIANNTGFTNEQSPEAIKSLTDGLMASAAWSGAILSWAAFDRLDDVLYHKTFFGTGMSIGLAFSAAAMTATEAMRSLTDMSFIKAVWRKAVQSGKNSIAAMTLATNLTLKPVPDEKPPVFIIPPAVYTTQSSYPAPTKTV